MAAKDLVVSLARRIGLGEPAFTDGITAIQFDDMTLNFHADEEAGELGLFMDVGAVPAAPDERLAVYGRLLRHNAFARQTGGGVLGIDEEESRVLFSHAFAAAALDDAWLERVVEAFLNLAETFRAELAAPAVPPPAANAVAGGVRV